MGIEPLDALVIWRWFRAESLASHGRPRCPHGRSPHIRESVPAVRPHADAWEHAQRSASLAFDEIEQAPRQRPKAFPKRPALSCSARPPPP
jgi:hypothetical protein